MTFARMRRRGRAIGGMIVAAFLATGCVSSQTLTRTVELDDDSDVAFRAAAATLLDDRQLFEVSDRDAGLVIGSPSQLYSSQTTFWITPLPNDRSFVVIQMFEHGTRSEVAIQEDLDWLVRRLRQRCLLAGDVTPFADPDEGNSTSEEDPG